MLATPLHVPVLTVKAAAKLYVHCVIHQWNNDAAEEHELAGNFCRACSHQLESLQFLIRRLIHECYLLLCMRQQPPYLVIFAGTEVILAIESVQSPLEADKHQANSNEAGNHVCTFINCMP